MIGSEAHGRGTEGIRTGPRRLRDISGRSREAWLWIPLLLAGAYVISLPFHFRAIVNAFYLDPDTAAGPTIGQLVSQAPPGAHIVLGNIPWYSELWFEELTRWLPDHRQVWEVTPWLLGLIGIGCASWATARVAGRWAGGVVAVACACAGAGLMHLQFAWSVHALAYPTICLFGAATVWIALQAQGSRDASILHWLELVLLTVVVGIQLACDNLVLVGGLIPFALSGGLLVYVLAPSARRWAAARLITVGVGSIVVAVLTTIVAHAMNISAGPFSISFAQLNQLWTQVGDLVGSIVTVADGTFGGATASLTSVFEFLAAVAVIAGLWATVRIGIQTWRQAPALACPTDEDPGDPVLRARTVFLGFWLISGVLVALLFTVTNLPVGLQTFRYVVTCAYAVIIVVAVGAGTSPRRWLRMVLTAGVSAIVFSAVLNVVQETFPTQELATAKVQQTAEIAAFARAEGLTYGYAGYAYTYPITWGSDEEVQLYPVSDCSLDGGLCAWPEHRISSWYRARPHTRSFLVTDPVFAPTAPAALGKPSVVAHFGQLTVYVYPYDIGAKISLSSS